MKRAPAREPFLFVAAKRSGRSSRVGFEDSRVLARGRPAGCRRIPPSPPEQMKRAPAMEPFLLVGLERVQYVLCRLSHQPLDVIRYRLFSRALVAKAANHASVPHQFLGASVIVQHGNVALLEILRYACADRLFAMKPIPRRAQLLEDLVG